ncbi:efflux transporter outer membrane subunit [Hydrogenophaga sp.]|uniref:efflux transporter outer membrane subunit n=1 Tax=Hydrogenophaga sp. TaxID=1904254 RepID=UPI002726EB8D|nr:efflux transporter outer membrane subunit [Hydrogenophaga sp.]MDO8903490.1 efflux transporter outer membrane subunit [Hydrogenophaga sp.]
MNPRMPAHARLVFLSLCAGLAACASAPPAPEAPTLGLEAVTRFEGAALDAPDAQEVDLRWWHRFDDPVMAQWVERALEHSPDIAIARERAVQARALLRGASGQRNPQIGGELTLQGRTRRNADTRAVAPSAAIGLEWDADLWGGLRQAERSAAATVLRSDDLVQVARLSTAALTARAYVAWREALHDERLLTDALDLQAEVLRLVRVRVDAGLSPQLDLNRAEAEAASLTAESADAVVRVNQAGAALQVLAGERPGSLDGGDAPRLPSVSGAQAVVRPLDLLRLRPDLRAAENALTVAAADLGVAKSDLYPRLRLPGSITLTSSALSGGALNIVTASIAAVLDATLFDGGQRRAGVEVAESVLRESVEVYRQTLLQALQQTEAALVGASGARRRALALDQGLTAASAAVTQARVLYDNGLSGFLDVIDAQRSELDTRRRLLVAQADGARQSIATFEAMGLIAPGIGL